MQQPSLYGPKFGEHSGKVITNFPASRLSTNGKIGNYRLPILESRLGGQDQKRFSNWCKAKPINKQKIKQTKSNTKRIHQLVHIK